MCILVINKGDKIPFDNFLQMWERNPHGLGMMWTYKKTDVDIVDTWKSNDISNVTRLKMWYDEEYLRLKSDSNVENLCIHFRYATVGDICEENTHPYDFVDGNAQLVSVMHNGTMPEDYKGYSSSRLYNTSDTKNFISDYLVKNGYVMDHLTNHEGLEIGNEIGYGKLVTLTAEGTLNVFNYDLGYEIGGNWFSNMRWAQSVSFNSAVKEL